MFSDDTIAAPADPWPTESSITFDLDLPTLVLTEILVSSFNLNQSRYDLSSTLALV